MRVRIEPTNEERKAFKAKVEAIGKLEGLELAQAFADNAHEAAENDLLREVIAHRLMERIGEGDLEVVRAIKEGSVEAKQQTELFLSKTDGKVH